MKKVLAKTPPVAAKKNPTSSKPVIGQEIADLPAFEDYSPGFTGYNDIRRVMNYPRTLTPGAISHLQRTVGNKSVQRLLQGHQPSTLARVSSPAMIQRFRETFTTQAGQTWQAIAILHGFNSANNTPQMMSFIDSNNITRFKLNDVIPTATSVKLPKNIHAVSVNSNTPVTTPSQVTPSGPPPIPQQAEIGSVFAAVGGFLDWAVPKSGDKYTFDFGFRVPIGGGFFLGLKLSGEAERDDADSNGVSPLKIDSKLGIEGKSSYTFLYYGQIDFGASLVRNIKAESKRGGVGVMEALSFGLYRSVQETSYIPGRLMNWIWGNDRENWSARTAGRIATADDKVFIGFAGGASAGSKSSKTVTGEDTSEIGVEVGGSTGTEYSKDSITSKGTSDGAGGYKGTTTPGWFGSTESSLGETKNTVEVTVKAQVLGTEVSLKVTKEGDEWGLEFAVNVGTFSKLEGESASEKAANLYKLVKEYAGAIGGKLSELIKAVAQTIKLSRAASRNVSSIANLITNTKPSSDQFALVLYQGTKGPSTPEVLTLPASKGWYNVDEGKYEQDAKFNLAVKANLSKKEVSFGLDVNFEAGFDSSALTIKGSKTKRIVKW